MPPLPASVTKHLDVVHHPLPQDPLLLLPLRQLSASTGREGTGSTGTTLWLGGQVLGAYISSLPSPKSKKRAIELGAGVGFLSLVAAALGYDVISTDIPPVLDTVLRPNIEDGLRALHSAARSTLVFPISNGRTVPRATTQSTRTGEIRVCELDWMNFIADPEVWADTILTSDTIYQPALLPALFRTIRQICQSSSDRGVRTTIYLALERRDSRMVNNAMASAGEFGIRFKRVGQGRIVKCVRETGWGWADEDWEGVEVYKGRWAPLGEDQEID